MQQLRTLNNATASNLEGKHANDLVLVVMILQKSRRA